MPHIHTDDGQHDLTASALIIRTDFAEPKIMVHWHKKLKSYLQFGGHVELDENPWQSIAHELREESGYDITSLKILQPHDRMGALTDGIRHPEPITVNTFDYPGTPNKHLHTDLAFGFVASAAPVRAIAEGESDKIVCFSAAELKALSSDEILENVRVMSLYALETCYPKWEQVDTAEFKL